jgi:ABC-2 type transport system permease protein
MSKVLAVFKREYIQAVRKKMFIIMTFLMPFLMAALMVLPSMLMMKGLGEKRVLVVDGTGQLRDAVERAGKSPAETKPVDARQQAREAMQGKRQMQGPASVRTEYVDARGWPDLKKAAAPYLDRLNAEKTPKSRQLDAVVIVPADAIENNETHLTYYGRSSTELIAQERLSRMINRGIQRHRLTARGIDPAEIEKLTRDVQMDAVQLSRTGEQRKGGELNFLFGFVFVALLVIPVLVYGTEIMRGIIQEKSDRVVEVLVSSMTPLQLLTGKIFGVAVVGLTQLAAWIVMASVGAGYLAVAANAAGMNVMQFLQPAIFAYFLLFFLLAYLTYVCVYAVGGAISNSDKEAQQLMGPIMIFLLLPWILMAPIIMNPDSKLAVTLSLSPIFAPMTMFVRVLVSDPPATQIILAVAISIVTIAVLFWGTAKIFRIGILSYGKRPTIPELWRWMKVA